MAREERFDRFRDDELDRRFVRNKKSFDREWEKEEDDAVELLPTISIIHIPHAKIPNLYQYCFEYVDPLGWSAEAELVETGRWFFDPPKAGS